jgi:hypothetical protein
MVVITWMIESLMERRKTQVKPSGCRKKAGEQRPVKEQEKGQPVPVGVLHQYV